MINHEYKFIFCHVNKTGGTSVYKSLQKETGEAKHDHKILREYKVECFRRRSSMSNYFKFSFVRNPWDKMVSMYSFRRKSFLEKGFLHPNTHYEMFNSFIKLIYCGGQDWVKAVYGEVEAKNVIRYKKNLRDKLVTSSYLWLVDRDGKMLADFVGRFENLQNDYNTICEKIGIKKAELPHIYKSSRNPYQEYYSQESIDMVAKAFKEDIKHFGYKYEN